jgi:hypothetical protein
MRLRDFVALMGTAVMWPLAAAPQSKPTPVIAILDPDVAFIFDAFVEGMGNLGYVEGRNERRLCAQGRAGEAPIHSDAHRGIGRTEGRRHRDGSFVSGFRRRAKTTRLLSTSGIAG